MTSVVMITGCSTGFGHLTAVELARAGDRVYATMRDPSKGQSLETLAAAEGLELSVLQLDVGDDVSVRAAIDEIVAREARLDAVVNNAGISIQGPAEEFDDDEVTRIFDTNVFGPHRVIRAAVPLMREQRFGIIVNVTSIAGLVVSPFFSFYTASKHALEALSESLYYEVLDFGIDVHLVEPGGFRTGIVENAARARRVSESSPYWPRFGPIIDKVQRSLADAPHGQPVADAIRRAIHDPDAPFRLVVGADAQQGAALRKRMDDAEWLAAVRQSSGWPAAAASPR